MTTDTRGFSTVPRTPPSPSRPGRICVMRVCIVYDCLYPFTIGGAERWYRNLAERLASSGHEVTFLTRRQWGRGEDPGVPGVHVVAVSPRMELYARGRRRVLPPLLFGLGVLGHLLRHGGRYDVVHTASFPYFSLLAAAAVRRRGTVPPAGRLARGLDPRVLARISGFRRRSGRMADSACLPACPPARVLLLSAPRASSARARDSPAN